MKIRNTENLIKKYQNYFNFLPGKPSSIDLIQPENVEVNLPYKEIFVAPKNYKERDCENIEFNKENLDYINNLNISDKSAMFKVSKGDEVAFIVKKISQARKAFYFSSN